jgi:predicted RNA polymerase sigma factor
MVMSDAQWLSRYGDRLLAEDQSGHAYVAVAAARERIGRVAEAATAYERAIALESRPEGDLEILELAQKGLQRTRAAARGSAPGSGGD